MDTRVHRMISSREERTMLLKPEAQHHIESFLSLFRQASEALLMLDYDGTLAPFHTERDRAFPYPSVAAALQEIVRDGYTRVVIVSGRDVGDTVPLLGIQPCPEVWGVHGLQRQKADGSLETIPLDSRVLDALGDAGRWLGYQQLQDMAEFKTGSLAVHWRSRSEWEAEEIRGRVVLGWKPIADHTGLDLLEFDGGLEIRAPEADKGEVVRTLLSETSPQAPVAYLGDDTTDERAFRAIEGRGLSVLVRPRGRRTAAQLWLKPPEELFDFLTQWLEAARGRDARRETAVAVSG
jgi:trehalose 6-phosphate phosphatase